MKENLLELQNITKSFGHAVAVDGVNFALQAGEIHAILGENGAGKSTLMNLIYGLYYPSAGSLRVSGESKTFRSPRDAIANGIGMVHQHFMLIENLTVAENIALSLGQLDVEDRSTAVEERKSQWNRVGGHPLFQAFKALGPLRAWRKGRKGRRMEAASAPQSSNLPVFQSFWFKKESAVEITAALSQRFGLAVDPSALVRTLSVGLKQRVEILKALAVDARILILDEPTAVLSPQEVNGFFTILRKLQADNRAIIFISHKMKEVLEISDRITVLRRGKKVYVGKTGELTARELAREMLGQEVAEVARSGLETPPTREGAATKEAVLQISELTVRGGIGVRNASHLAVADVSMETYRGEIVGIAGVDGNGQRELTEAIMGLRPLASGKIEILGTAPKGTKEIRQRGVGYIPEDRQTMGVIAAFSIAENLLLNVTRLADVAKWGVIDGKAKQALSKHLVTEYDIRPPNAHMPAEALSGGNQQKVVLAREISPNPELLIAVNPTRGLDISAAHDVHQNLLAQRDRKKSVLLISTELDEVLQLSDRIYVMSSGKLIEATAYRDDIAALGVLMTGETRTDV